MALTETLHAGAFIVSEEPCFSRDAIVVSAGAGILQAGTVLGEKTSGVVTSAVKASGANTGTGTLVVDATTPVLANAIVGLYQVRCITSAANAATFRVTDPKGTVLGDVSFNGSGTSGAFADRIKFAVTDGATDFIAGDGFDVSVTSVTKKYVAAPATSTDGSDVATAVLFDRVNATSADVTGVAVKRLAEVRAADLTFDASVSNATLIGVKLAQLAAVGIISR